MPINKTQRRIFTNYLSNVNKDNPLTFYVGSCPDYTHDGEYYTHKGVGGDVPLLTIKHLASAKHFIEVLETERIAYEYVIMVADVEALDEVFCNKFTGGDQNKFLKLCMTSVEATKRFIDYNFNNLEHGKLRSSSFFTEFGMPTFIDTENKYKQLLHENYESGGNMRSRIYGDTYSRMGMYNTMYDGILQRMGRDEKEEFLIRRTERTMAQYLALGRLISQNNRLSSIICHPTLNMNMFNDRNKLLLPEDSKTIPQPTIPVFQMSRRVYP